MYARNALSILNLVSCDKYLRLTRVWNLSLATQRFCMILYNGTDAPSIPTDVREFVFTWLHYGRNRSRSIEREIVDRIMNFQSSDIFSKAIEISYINTQRKSFGSLKSKTSSLLKCVVSRLFKQFKQDQWFYSQIVCMCLKHVTNCVENIKWKHSNQMEKCTCIRHVIYYSELFNSWYIVNSMSPFLQYQRII